MWLQNQIISIHRQNYAGKIIVNQLLTIILPNTAENSKKKIIIDNIREQSVPRMYWTDNENPIVGLYYKQTNAVYLNRIVHADILIVSFVSFGSL